MTRLGFIEAILSSHTDMSEKFKINPLIFLFILAATEALGNDTDPQSVTIHGQAEKR